MKNVLKLAKLKHQLSLPILLFCLLFAPSLSAQQVSDHNKEIGLRATGFNNFNLIYKKKKGVNKFRRYRVGVATIGFSTNQNVQAFSLQTNMAIGIEKRKPINDKFYFIHGTEFLGNFNIAASEDRGDLNVSSGIGFVLGFQYNIAKSFYVNLETIPSIRGSFAIDENGFRDAFSLNAGFNSQLAALSLVYQFKSRKKES